MVPCLMLPSKPYSWLIWAFVWVADCFNKRCAWCINLRSYMGWWSSWLSPASNCVERTAQYSKYYYLYTTVYLYFIQMNTAIRSPRECNKTIWQAYQLNLLLGGGGVSFYLLSIITLEIDSTIESITLKAHILKNVPMICYVCYAMGKSQNL